MSHHLHVAVLAAVAVHAVAAAPPETVPLHRNTAHERDGNEPTCCQVSVPDPVVQERKSLLDDLDPEDAHGDGLCPLLLLLTLLLLLLLLLLGPNKRWKVVCASL